MNGTAQSAETLNSQTKSSHVVHHLRSYFEGNAQPKVQEHKPSQSERTVPAMSTDCFYILTNISRVQPQSTFMTPRRSQPKPRAMSMQLLCITQGEGKEGKAGKARLSRTRAGKPGNRVEALAMPGNRINAAAELLARVTILQFLHSHRVPRVKAQPVREPLSFQEIKHKLSEA